MKVFRASALHKLITEPKPKSQLISKGAKTAIRAIAKEDVFGYRDFSGNRYTAKGIELEQIAIDLSAQCDFTDYSKHAGRVSNDLITGECDILTDNRVIDIKCSWDIGSHPFTQAEALEKAVDVGYHIQMQAYMWLYDRPVAELHFWLLPCPASLLNEWDDIEQLVHAVEQIDVWRRRTVLTIERDDAVIERFKEILPRCQQFYEQVAADYKAVING